MTKSTNEGNLTIFGYRRGRGTDDGRGPSGQLAGHDDCSTTRPADATPAADTPNLRLVINAPHGEQWDMHIRPVVSIGRASDNTIRVDHRSVSRYHAVIEARDGQYWLRDLGSTNGTVLNRNIVEFEAVLSADDEIGIAGVATIDVESVAVEE